MLVRSFMKRLPYRIFVLVLSLILLDRPCKAGTPDTQPTAGPEVNVLAMGDWGSNSANQRAVADRLAQYAQERRPPIDAMLLAGDNFYIKLSSTKDPLWQTLFEQMYDPARLNFPFYATFGNHDYREQETDIELAYARENPKSRWRMPARYYRLDWPSSVKPLVSALMLDSNRDSMSPVEWRQELDWIRAELAKPRPTWLVACAHHPLYSNGDHGDVGPLQKDWGAMFDEARLDLFIAGHDHDLQHLELPGHAPSFLLVGGGGATTRPMRVDRRGPFSTSGYGFAHVNFTPQQMTARIVRVDGQVVHEFIRDAGIGRMTVRQSLPSDPAIPRTPGSVSRGGAETPTTKPVKPSSD
jgi:tartrate-resistant acid phosphatase type 5